MSHTRWGWSLFLSHLIFRKIADKPQTITKILWFWRSWRRFCFSKRLVSPGVRRQRSQSLERARCSSVLTITNNHINILNLWHWDWLSHENFNPMTFTIQINLDNNASDVYRFSTIDKNENLPHHDIDQIGMAFAHAHVASSMMIHQSSPSFYQESPPWTHCVLAASSYRPCFPLTPWYWNILSSGIETFFPWY